MDAQRWQGTPQGHTAGRRQSQGQKTAGQVGMSRAHSGLWSPCLEGRSAHPMTHAVWGSHECQHARITLEEAVSFESRPRKQTGPRGVKVPSSAPSFHTQPLQLLEVHRDPAPKALQGSGHWTPTRHRRPERSIQPQLSCPLRDVQSQLACALTP